MHSKAADWAAPLDDALYAVKGLRSNFGTQIDDTVAVDSQRPVTGITALRNISFARVIGGAEEDEARRQLEVSLFSGWPTATSRST